MKSWIIYALSILFLALGACKRVTLVVDEVPPNTPPGSSIFMAGSVNIWEPGDDNFQFTKSESGKYYLDLPLGFGRIKYKLTRGDWTTVEGDACGHPISDRWTAVGNVLYDWFPEDTVHLKVFSWEDLGPVNCETVTFRIRNLPKGTPPGDDVYLSGSFNEWNPRLPNYKLKKSPQGFYYFTMGKYDSRIEFKFTRGSWDKEETDLNGDRIPNRQFSFGVVDTLDLEIPGWVDVKAGMEERDVVFLVTTPGGTPISDPLYIVGNFNHWVPADPRFKMKKLGANLFSIKMRKPHGEMEYKFTRGPWGMEEADVFGNQISNRRLKTSDDTIRITIPEWADIPVEQTYTFKQNEIKYLIDNPDMIAFPVRTGEKIIHLQIKNSFNRPTQVFVRVALPVVSSNHNYGFQDVVKPGKVFKLICPENTEFYACDRPFWMDNRPSEKLVFRATADQDNKVIDMERFVVPPKAGSANKDKSAGSYDKGNLPSQAKPAPKK